MATSSKIRIIALMRGIPLRIAATPLPPTGEVDENGKPIPPKKDKQQTDEASVDSELTMLSAEKAEIKALRQNPYFKSDTAVTASNLGPMMLVGRIDGPDWETATRLITDAIAAEKSGLWGDAYLDLARLDLTKGAGYKIGDEWIRNIGKAYSSVGIPTYIDKVASRLPPEFPMSKDTILYFGWYVQNADGPL